MWEEPKQTNTNTPNTPRAPLPPRPTSPATSRLAVIVGPNGKASAGARAREVDVLGRIDGDVETQEEISIRNGGQLVGDINAAGIVIEDGAYFKGSIDIVRRAQEAAPKKETA